MEEGRVVQLLRSEVDSRPQSECPTGAEVATYVEGQVTASERRVLEQHLADCRRCRDRVGFLVRSAAIDPNLPTPHALIDRARSLGATGGGPAVPRWRTVAAAAAVIVAGCAAVWLWPFGLPVGTPQEQATGVPSDAPLIRGPDRNGPAPELLSPREGSLVESRQVELAWQPVPDALFYEISLADAEGNLLWEGRAEETSLQVPQEVLLDPGADHFVWVSAWLLDGRRVRSSIVGFRAKGGEVPD